MQETRAMSTRVLGIIIVASALLIAGIAQTNNCLAEGKQIQLRDAQGNPTKMVPMKCYWTAQPELATGGTLLLVGGMMALRKRKESQESQRNLAILGTALGAFTRPANGPDRGVQLGGNGSQDPA